MIGLALALCLAAADEPSLVRVQLGAQSGGLFGDSDPARPVVPGVPAVIGGHLGLHASKPGGIAILIAAEARHAFHASKTEWLGRVGVGTDLWRVTLLVGSGFGFSWMRGAGLRPIVPLTASMLIHLPGPVAGFVVGLSYERMFQLRAFADVRPGNAVAAVDSRILLNLSKDFDLTD